MSDRRTTAHWQADLALAQLTARALPTPTPLPKLEAADVQLHLRDSGVVVHHVARMPTPRDGRQVVVVFLDGTAEQVELGRAAAKRLPGVLDVVFSGYNRAVMYIIASPAHPVLPPHPGQPSSGAQPTQIGQPNPATQPTQAARPTQIGQPTPAGRLSQAARPNQIGHPNQAAHPNRIGQPNQAGQPARAGYPARPGRLG